MVAFFNQVRGVSIASAGFIPSVIFTRNLDDDSHPLAGPVFPTVAR